MALTLKRADVVALGSFNPTIPDAGWYMREGLVGTDEGISLQVQLGRPSAKYQSSKIRWVVSMEKFTAEVVEENLAEETVGSAGEFLAETLDRLSHTPLTALGHNFAFDLELEPGSYVETFLALGRVMSTPFGSGAALSATRASFVDAPAGSTLNVDVRLRGQAHEISCNVHRLVATAEDGAKAARMAVSDFQRVKNALNQLTRGRQ